jgi:hypothetical protein
MEWKTIIERMGMEKIEYVGALATTEDDGI